MQTYFFIWSQKLEEDALENTMHYDQKDTMWGSFPVEGSHNNICGREILSDTMWGNFAI